MIIKVLRTIVGIIVALLAMGVIVQVMRFLGPAIGGWIVMLLNLSPTPDIAEDMEAAGNIFVFIVSLYAGVKVYKKIVNNKTSERK